MDFLQTGVTLAEATRGGWVENTYTGGWIVTRADGAILHESPGAGVLKTFFRSAGKPFQAMPLVLERLHQDLSEEELAICCASHGGSQVHLDLATSILKKAGLDESALQCGPHAPLDKTIQEKLQAEGAEPHRLHNNCSGKHAGMLYYCVRQGLETSNYLDPQHPLQQTITKLLELWSGENQIPLGIDGCGAPIPYFSLRTMAALFARLGVDDVAKPIVEAMVNHPRLIGDPHRLDTLLMELSDGKLLAKVGADGVLAVSRVGQGEGLFIKLTAGLNDIRDKVTVVLLHQLGWLNSTAFEHPKLGPYRNTEILNTQGKVVGNLQFHL